MRISLWEGTLSEHLGENQVTTSRFRPPKLRDRLTVTAMQGFPSLTTGKPTPDGLRGGGTWYDVGVQLFFCSGYSVFPAPIVEKMILSPLNCLGNLVVILLIINVRVCFWTLYLESVLFHWPICLSYATITLSIAVDL